MVRLYWATSAGGVGLKHLVTGERAGHAMVHTARGAMVLPETVDDLIPCPLCMEALMDLEAEAVEL